MGKSETWLTCLLITSRFNVAFIWNYTGQEDIIFVLCRVSKDLSVAHALPLGSDSSFETQLWLLEIPLADPLYHLYPSNPHFLNANEADPEKAIKKKKTDHAHQADCLLSTSSPSDC